MTRSKPGKAGGFPPAFLHAASRSDDGRNGNVMMNQGLQKVLAILTLVLLAGAWVAGSMRATGAESARLANISPDIVGIQKAGDNLYTAQRKGAPQPVPPADQFYIAIAEHPGYGGPLHMAVVVNGEKRIEHVAVLQSADTSTYISKVVSMNVLDAFLGKSVDAMPKVDTISGATLSSTAIITAVQRASALIGNTRFNMPAPVDSSEIGTREIVKSVLVMLFFVLAVVMSLKAFPLKTKWLRLALLVASVVVLGFMYGTQFSLSTMVILLAGFWTKGMASYAPLLCLVLAILAFFATKKNLFCASICPFGGLQECLSRITNCSPPPTTRWMKFLARALALAALCAALYFRAPSDAAYEPFGRTFNFIGSGVLFGLSILIIVTSLAFKRPWCRLLCPMTPLFDYFQFMRTWIAGLRKRGGATRAKASEAGETL